ncbi:hypothetical protein GCM10009555_079340 [Acrocarpospora macrocephala]|uniref:non-specific serine/threonine protein kinase n=1 Tax=Acrocarpospora macrocephala TaxID=150177 RepID=A0A5M3X1F7_9ACTN|nr:hypothetical protein [Acrocarpospora macrocephala]GES13969.1 hypothetical protein Amac_075660 [Acrocarpospora macrocephala]
MAGPDGSWHGNVEQVDGEGADVGDGVDLRLLIREEGATGFAAALLVLKGTLVAQAAAHRDGAVYPDLAPENVIVTPAGGIRLTADPAETPAYKAPELWRGAPASPASDIYAATAVFFECLTGGPPFDAAAAARLGWLHRTVPPPVEQVPEGLRRLVERGLSKAPQHRPSSAAAFAAEVEAVAVAALGPDWERPGRVALAALASSHASAVPEEPVSPPAAPRPSRVKVATLVALAAAAVVVVAVSAGDRPSRQSHQAAEPPARPAVTLLPTPSLVVVQPVENSEPLPVHHKPVVIAEETGSPRIATPRQSPTPTPKAKKPRISESQAPDASADPVPDGESQQPPPPASEPASAPILEVEASVELPILGGNGLDVSVGVGTGLLGLSL